MCITFHVKSSEIFEYMTRQVCFTNISENISEKSNELLDINLITKHESVKYENICPQIN